MSIQSSLQESGAISLLKRAVELDTEGRYPESVVNYESALEIMIRVIKGTKSEEIKAQLRTKINEYMARAEVLKKLIKKQIEDGKYHEVIPIENDSIGHSYPAVFGRFLDSDLTEVEVEDAYIRNTHQVSNFVRFCEMLLTSPANIKKIILTTGADIDPNSQNGQNQRLGELAASLQARSIELKINFSQTLHDREIRFNNGWIIKIGRGLDYFKAADGKFSIGSCDMSLRRCHETTINIFHKNFTKSTSDSSS